MNSLLRSFIRTYFVFLFVQIGIISGLGQRSIESTNFNELTMSSDPPVTNFTGRIDEQNNDILENEMQERLSEISNLLDRAFPDYSDPTNGENGLNDRRKRDIRSALLENELQMVIGTYNSEMVSQAKSAVDSIISGSNDLNGLRNLLSFNFNNLATNGLNDLSSIASNLPVAIQKCYQFYGFKFSDAIGVAKLTAQQCLVNKTNEAKSIAEDFKNSITDAAANLKEVATQITQCQLLANLYPSIAGLIAKASCLNIAIFSIRGETILLPIKFAALIGKAYNSIVTIRSDMYKCGLEIITTVLDQSIQSGKAINNCINEQNGVTNSTALNG